MSSKLWKTQALPLKALHYYLGITLHITFLLFELKPFWFSSQPYQCFMKFIVPQMCQDQMNGSLLVAKFILIFRKPLKSVGITMMEFQTVPFQLHPQKVLMGFTFASARSTIVPEWKILERGLSAELSLKDHKHTKNLHGRWTLWVGGAEKLQFLLSYIYIACFTLKA